MIRAFPFPIRGPERCGGVTAEELHPPPLQYLDYGISHAHKPLPPRISGIYYKAINLFDYSGPDGYLESFLISKLTGMSPKC